MNKPPLLTNQQKLKKIKDVLDMALKPEAHEGSIDFASFWSDILLQTINQWHLEQVEEIFKEIEGRFMSFLHWHRGEWCFTPKKYAEFIDWRQQLKSKYGGVISDG